MKLLIITIAVSLFNTPVFAQKVEINDNPETVEVVAPERSYRTERPQTGKKAAEKYFRRNTEESSSTRSDSAPSDHFLMLGIGAFVDSTAYRWGDKNKSNPGEFNLDVTYRFGEWVNSMDFLFRIDYQTYDLNADKQPKKISFLPTLIFPDAGSKFPVYFGVAGGAGIFFSQLSSKSSLSLDYQLLLGARMFDIFENTGFFVETGMKNHLLLLSSGQFNGFYVNVGSVHTF